MANIGAGCSIRVAQALCRCRYGQSCPYLQSLHAPQWVCSSWNSACMSLSWSIYSRPTHRELARRARLRFGIVHLCTSLHPQEGAVTILRGITFGLSPRFPSEAPRTHLYRTICLDNSVFATWSPGRCIGLDGSIIGACPQKRKFKLMKRH